MENNNNKAINLIEKVYTEVKVSLKEGTFTVKNVEELADLFSELAARKKEESADEVGDE